MSEQPVKESLKPKEGHIWDAVNKMITVVGLLATVFSCAVAILALVAPQTLTRVLVEISHSASEPGTVVITAVPESTVETIVVTATTLPTVQLSPTPDLDQIAQSTMTGVWDFDMLIKQRIGSNGFITDVLDSAKWVIRLEQSNESFSGEIIGAQPSNTCLDATINGSVQGNEVTFVIKYQGSCCFSEQMTFNGIRNSDGGTLTGNLEPIGIPHGGCSLWFAELTASKR